MKAQTTTAPTGACAARGHAVSFVNCRHAFGESLRWDAVVDGAYPDRSACLWLHQPGPWRSAYVAIPFPTVDCAEAVVDAISAYHLCNVFQAGEPIKVSLCWDGAPNLDLTIAV